MRLDVSSIERSAIPVDLPAGIGLGLQLLQNTLPEAIARPAHEAVIAGLPGAVARRHVAPRRARLFSPENAIENTPVVNEGVTTARIGRQQWLQLPPLLLGQVGSAHRRIDSSDADLFSQTDPSYSLKKLQNLGLVRAERRGKETLYSTTDRGHDLCGRYRDLRERFLVLEIGNTGVHGHDLSAIAQFLRVLSGMYDQAARAATTM